MTTQSPIPFPVKPYRWFSGRVENVRSPIGLLPGDIVQICDAIHGCSYLGGTALIISLSPERIHPWMRALWKMRFVGDDGSVWDVQIDDDQAFIFLERPSENDHAEE